MCPDRRKSRSSSPAETFLFISAEQGKEREKERERERWAKLETWSECDHMEQQQVYSTVQLFPYVYFCFLQSKGGSHTVVDQQATNCVSVILCNQLSPNLSLSSSMYASISLSSSLFGEIGKWSHFFVIMQTKDEILLKLS